MENKLISRILFGIVAVLFVVSFYFFYGMMTNGAPKDYDPDQMGIELYDAKQADATNYLEKGEEAYDAKIKSINSHILGGINYLKIMLYIAGGLMVLFLIFGLVMTMMGDFRKAVPSLIFVGIALITFIYAFINSGSDTAGFDVLVSKEGAEAAKPIISTTNFWVNGLLFVLIPGAALLVIDLVKDIVKGFAK